MEIHNHELRKKTYVRSKTQSSNFQTLNTLWTSTIDFCSNSASIEYGRWGAEKKGKGKYSPTLANVESLPQGSEISDTLC